MKNYHTGVGFIVIGIALLLIRFTHLSDFIIGFCFGFGLTQLIAGFIKFKGNNLRKK